MISGLTLQAFRRCRTPRGRLLGLRALGFHRATAAVASLAVVVSAVPSTNQTADAGAALKAPAAHARIAVAMMILVLTFIRPPFVLLSRGQYL